MKNGRNKLVGFTPFIISIKDESIIDKETVEDIEKVQGAFFNSGQYQIIFGTGTVNKIYDEVVEQSNFNFEINFDFKFNKHPRLQFKFFDLKKSIYIITI